MAAQRFVQNRNPSAAAAAIAAPRRISIVVDALTGGGSSAYQQQKDEQATSMRGGVISSSALGTSGSLTPAQVALLQSVTEAVNAERRTAAKKKRLSGEHHQQHHSSRKDGGDLAGPEASATDAHFNARDAYAEEAEYYDDDEDEEGTLVPLDPDVEAAVLGTLPPPPDASEAAGRNPHWAHTTSHVRTIVAAAPLLPDHTAALLLRGQHERTVLEGLRVRRAANGQIWSLREAPTSIAQQSVAQRAALTGGGVASVGSARAAGSVTPPSPPLSPRQEGASSSGGRLSLSLSVAPISAKAEHMLVALQQRPPSREAATVAGEDAIDDDNNEGIGAVDAPSGGGGGSVCSDSLYVPPRLDQTLHGRPEC